MNANEAHYGGTYRVMYYNECGNRCTSFIIADSWRMAMRDPKLEGVDIFKAELLTEERLRELESYGR